MKTIKLGNTEYEMTDERKRRTMSALAETQSKLNKELAYSEDLQHKDMIEFYRNHIAKLESWLS